jgi:hypothetical protein
MNKQLRFRCYLRKEHILKSHTFKYGNLTEARADNATQYGESEKGITSFWAELEEERPNTQAITCQEYEVTKIPSSGMWSLVTLLLPEHTINLEDSGNIFLRYVCKLPNYIVPHPRSYYCSQSLQWKPQIQYVINLTLKEFWVCKATIVSWVK